MGVVFDRLRVMAEARGAVLELQALRPGEQVGYFAIVPGVTEPQQVICVRAISGDTRIVDDVEDSITLAHEMGHHTRHRTGAESALYRAIVDTPQATWMQAPRETREAICHEEREAWALARADLEAVGFTAWDAFERRRDASLTTYLEGLVSGEVLRSDDA